ncbi:TetR family transcriptional regulator [Mycobacterium sp. 852013-50091_SCH5140682]|uniref:TetR/AcrR family transcriptional regulator n=1 Tax=Mycobacterium sp. 852013-50091_SCH5140682 TaxID=1834109 RepID=UPI0007E9FD7C|nr:TetR/AcrR family transcriptional regulator [Mycobacterium sp. 852013-50091_SCH5140682]OBC06011.1 TetR family transcriptional regulator [Mycobacterium sp. 852013-50091_SCH5140682]
MPRPRVHDPDTVLDAVESMAVSSGLTAVTIRAVSAAVGVSNGALYHQFGSRGGLLGRAWVRAAHRFLDLQRQLVEATSSGTDAIAAAAQAPAVFAEDHPASARLVLLFPPHEIAAVGLPDDLADEVAALQKQLLALMIELAQTAWGRRDRAAVDTVTTCIVDLPTAVLLQRDRLGDPTALRHLRAAVYAVLEIGPSPTTDNHHPTKGAS